MIIQYSKYANLAFISYKREDEKWAKWLQKKLEHYKLPTEVRKQNPGMEFAKNPRHVFKDTTDLSGGVLAKAIKDGLDTSKFLIVICSPRAAKSEWVCKEVQDFIDSGREEFIIPFIIDGEPYSKNPENECFPIALRSLAGERELLGINVNEYGRDYAAVKVVARLFDVKFDVLWNRFKREEKKKRFLIICSFIAAILFLLTIIAFGFFAYTEIKMQKDKAETAEKKATNTNIRLKAAYDSIAVQQLSLKAAYYDLNHTKQNLAVSNLSLKERNQELIEEKSRVKKKNYQLVCSQTRFVNKEVNALIDEGNLTLAARLLLQIVPSAFNDYDWPYVAETELTLRRLTDSLNNNHWHQIYTLHQDLKINTATFSHDDRMIVTSSNDNTARIWDSNIGTSLYEPFVHSGLVNCASFSNEDDMLVTGCRDKKVRVFDLKRVQLQNLYEIKGNVWNVVYRPNSDELVANSNRGLFFLNNNSNENFLYLPESSTINESSFSGDGDEFMWCFSNCAFIVKSSNVGKVQLSLLSCLNDENGEEKFFDFMNKTSRLLKIEEGKTIAKSGISFTGKYAFVISDDSIGYLFDTYYGEVIYQMKGVNSASFCNNESHIAFGGEGGKLVMLELPSLDICLLPNKSEDDVIFTVFSKDSYYFFATSKDKTLRIWNYDSERWEQDDVIVQDLPINKVVVNNKSNEIITLYGANEVKVWKKNKNIHNEVDLLLKNSFANSVDFSPNSDNMVIASKDKSVLVWNLRNKHLVFRTDCYKDMANYVNYSHDGKRIVVCFRDGGISVINAETGYDYNIRFETQRKTVNTSVFSFDDKYILTSDDKGMATLWNSYSGNAIKSFQHSNKLKKALFVSNDIVVTHTSDTVFLWSIPENKLISKIGMRKKSGFRDICVSKNGKMIAYCDDNNNIGIVKTSNLKDISCVWSHGDVRAPNRSVYAEKKVELNIVDSVWLKSTISGYNLGGQTYELLSHKSPVYTVGFCNNDSNIISSSGNCVRLWDTKTGTLVREIRHPWYINYSNMSCDGKFIVSHHSDNMESFMTVWKNKSYKELVEELYDRYSQKISEEEQKRYYLK